jgi:hypothetical protein
VDSDRLAAERHEALLRAVAELPEGQRALLLLVEDPPVSYEEISRRLGLPVESIGPTRAAPWPGCGPHNRPSAAVHLSSRGDRRRRSLPGTKADARGGGSLASGVSSGSSPDWTAASGSAGERPAAASRATGASTAPSLGRFPA